MYCHLCQCDVSLSHDGSSGHNAARELAAVAVDRLARHLEASGDPAAGTNTQLEVDKVKTPEAVGYCDCCNAVVPINEHGAHIRMKNHALALLDEQMFEELVQAYVNEGDLNYLKLKLSEHTDDGAFVDDTEAVNTYTCHLCSLEVPQVFKSEHERGIKHLASRILALAVARRTSSFLSRCSTEKSDNKFTGKMMKKLLRMYTGKEEEKKEGEDKVESGETEPTNSKRLTAKAYFTDILPYLPYVGSFHTVIIDDTEFVTIQINNETLRIHVNNFNGLYNLEGNCMNCRLCNGFSSMSYSSMGEQDKQHVMSLGHVRNVFSPFDNVHLIRKIDDSHTLCGLCNVHLNSHYVDEHIFKDTRHTTALTEALKKGKDYKEDKENLKIRIYTPPQKHGFMKPNQFNGWNYGIQQPRSGRLFGTTQTTGFGGTNTGFGSTQGTGFGNNQNTGFGSNQGTGFGSAQTTFGSSQTAFGPQTTNSGANQNSFGGNQSGGSNSSFGTTFGCAPTNRFGGIQGQNQNVINSTSNNQSTPAFGNSQSISAGFGAQKSGLFGSGQSTTPFGASQSNSSTSTKAPQQSANFGNSQSKTAKFGNPQAAQTTSSEQSNTGIVSTQKTVSFGIAQPTDMKYFFANTAGDNNKSNSPGTNWENCFGGLQQKNKAPINFFIKKPCTENITSPSQANSQTQSQNQGKVSGNEKPDFGAQAKPEIAEVTDSLKRASLMQPQRRLNYSSSSSSDSD